MGYYLQGVDMEGGVGVMYVSLCHLKNVTLKLVVLERRAQKRWAINRPKAQNTFHNCRSICKIVGRLLHR